jgi:hypothetical protein
MDYVIELLNKIQSLETVINCYLLYYDVRKSFLMQPYMNETRKDLYKVYDIIRQYFPLYFTIDIDQGLLVTKINTNIPFDINNYTDKQLGNFLSYPTAGILINKLSFAYSVFLVPLPNCLSV